MVARKYVSLNIEYPPLPRAFLKILKMTNMSSTEPAMHLTKVTMTTILSQRKAGLCKRDIEKTKGTDSIGPGNYYNYHQFRGSHFDLYVFKVSLIGGNSGL